MVLRSLPAILFLALVSCLSAGAQRAVPAHNGIWVHDEPNVLKPEVTRGLEAMLKAERDSTSNQIAVLIIQTLEGDEIAAYANRVFREWKLGQEKKDNGVLLLIALDERKIRIEVGYGLEGQLTDLLSSRIIRNEIAPEFRRGDIQAGVIKGVTAIIQIIQGSYSNDGRTSESGKPVPGLLKLLGIIVLVIIFSRFRRGGGSGGYWSPGGYMGGFGGGSGTWRGGGGWSSGGGGGMDFGGGGSSGGGGASGSW